MPRTIQPELLDSLPPDHPDALHNRRDLRITNRIMGNHRWFARTLPTLLRPGERILELGAGTGELALRLARRGLPVDALDLWPQPTPWPPARTWHQHDLQAFDRFADYRIVIGNLILHQFDDSALARLGATLRESTRLLVACEPTRRPLSQLLYRIVGPLLGVNHVSFHDAHVSIDAGFLGDELPQLLGLSHAAWDVRCHTTLFGAYRMIARRRA